MSKHILIIDDDDGVREVAQLALELGASWKVRTVSSGTAGIDAARTHPPDAILLDVMMPGLDGRGTLALLREDERTREIPVVFLTAKTRMTEREDLLTLGAAGVLAKPFDPLTLADQVATTLKWTV